MTAPTKTTTGTPTATVRAVPNNYGHSFEISVQISLPTAPDIAARAEARGVPSLRPQLLDACREEPAVARWNVLNTQIRAAEKRVAVAERTLERARAARVLLEDQPEENLAEKLRDIVARVAAAETEKRSAEADLDTIRHLIAKHWVAGAWAVHSTVSSPATMFAIGLSKPRDEARRELDRACEQVAAILQRAVAEHIVAPAAEAQAWGVAAAVGYEYCDTLERGVLETVMGPPPEGVRRAANALGGYEMVPAPRPEAPSPETVRPLVPQTLGGYQRLG